MIERAAVVAEALSWRGTPWHHKARIKGVGVDCAMFPAAVYEATGLIEHVDPDYPRQWMMHRERELFVEWVLHVGGREIERPAVLPGDLGLWHFGRTFSHGGIFVSQEQVIHAMVGAGVQLDEVNRHVDLSNREARYFTLWREE